MKTVYRFTVGIAYGLLVFLTVVGTVVMLAHLFDGWQYPVAFVLGAMLIVVELIGWEIVGDWVFEE